MHALHGSSRSGCEKRSSEDKHPCMTADGVLLCHHIHTYVHTCLPTYIHRFMHSFIQPTQRLAVGVVKKSGKYLDGLPEVLTVLCQQ